MRNDQKSSYLFIPHIQNTVISAGGGGWGGGGWGWNNRGGWKKLKILIASGVGF